MNTYTPLIVISWGNGQFEVMRSLKAIAIFEAAKGFAVVLLGIGVANIHHVAHHLGLKHSSHYTAIFIKAFNDLNDKDIWELALLAACYSAIRFTEAYGLWRERTWAEWLAILSGGIYLPFEIIKIVEKFEWWKVLITAFNLFIVAYLVWIRTKKSRSQQ